MKLSITAIGLAFAASRVLAAIPKRIPLALEYISGTRNEIWSSDMKVVSLESSKDSNSYARVELKDASLESSKDSNNYAIYGQRASNDYGTLDIHIEGAAVIAVLQERSVDFVTESFTRAELDVREKDVILLAIGSGAIEENMKNLSDLVDSLYENGTLDMKKIDTIGEKHLVAFYKVILDKEKKVDDESNDVKTTCNKAKECPVDTLKLQEMAISKDEKFFMISINGLHREEEFGDFYDDMAALGCKDVEWYADAVVRVHGTKAQLTLLPHSLAVIFREGKMVGMFLGSNSIKHEVCRKFFHNIRAGDKMMLILECSMSMTPLNVSEMLKRAHLAFSGGKNNREFIPQVSFSFETTGFITCEFWNEDKLIKMGKKRV